MGVLGVRVDVACRTIRSLFNVGAYGSFTPMPLARPICSMVEHWQGLSLMASRRCITTVRQEANSLPIRAGNVPHIGQPLRDQPLKRACRCNSKPDDSSPRTLFGPSNGIPSIVNVFLNRILGKWEVEAFIH